MQRITTTKNNPVYYQFDQWQHAPLKHGIFTRLGGVSDSHWNSLNVGSTVGDDPEAVTTNAERMYDSLAVNQLPKCTVWQVHGADTVVATEPPLERNWLTKADGLITNRKNFVLHMRFADCVPVLFYDPEHQAIGLAHAGWRGTVANIVGSVVDAMKKHYNSNPKNIQAAIGASISVDKYEVGTEVVDAVQQTFGTIDSYIHTNAQGQTFFDLWEANRSLLAKSGVKQVELANICTASNTDEFFSHRAEKGKTGRFGVVMVLTEN